MTAHSLVNNVKYLGVIFKNEEIRKELEVTALNDKITENRRKWNEYLSRMPEQVD
jgi:hypothetical protein